MRSYKLAACGAFAAIGWSISLPAAADITIGVIVSMTGSGASLGLPEEQSVQLWPSHIGSEPVRIKVLNDDSDTGTATKLASRLITEDAVDVIVGSSTTPVTLAILPIAAENEVPVISLAGGRAIVEPPSGIRRWAFKLTPTEDIQTQLVLDHFLSYSRNKTMAAIVLANSYGDGALHALEQGAAARGVKLLAREHYNGNDQTVTAQVLKVMATGPDAVYILSSGTPAALPHLELVARGYSGTIYQTQGIANADFLRLGGRAVQGAYLTVAPVLVAEQLPASHPAKAAGLDFLKRFDEKFGAKTRSLFAATAWDARLLLDVAASEALKHAKPGTPAFRRALRDALENVKGLVTTEGVFNMSATDHNGVDHTSQVLVKIDNGAWKLAP